MDAVVRATGSLLRLRLRTDREGIALLVVLLITMVVAAIAAGAALIGANSYLINQYDQRVSLLESVADAGLELARARLNGDPALFPDSAYNTLENHAIVVDAAGKQIPGVTRSVHVGPIGGGPGEYGSFGTIVAVARDAEGVETVRRLDLVQSSFALYSYFTDYEPYNIAFGNNDQLYGPVHSNSNIKIRETGATFHGPVTTAGIFEGANYATFLGDTITGSTRILMPSTSQFQRLKDRATPGHMVFTPTPGGTSTQSTMRIEFVARNVDADAALEGFLRVYESASHPYWVTGNLWPGYDYTDRVDNTRNCGHKHSDGVFRQTEDDDHGAYTAYTVFADASTARCYLGGARELWNGTFKPTDSWGQWRAYPGPLHPDLADEVDGPYLFPLDRDMNPGFRGVVYVEGKVVVSGKVRSRLTLAASGNIIVGDDLTYATDPGSGTCTDMLGLFSGSQIIIADNALNAPQLIPGTSVYRSFDDTRDEHIHGSLLALNQITTENWSSGSTSAEPCGGVSWGRGCLYITGGLIQGTRGPVSSTSGHGYVKRYTHDTCAYSDPPPYFPTTGHFWRGRYYEVDPSGFSVSAYFDALN